MAEEQLILNSENLPEYLKKAVFPTLAFKVLKIISIEEVCYGNNNFLFKIKVETDTGPRILFLKQAQPYNRRAMTQGEKKFVHPERLLGEYRAIEFLSQLWGREIVPEILFFDKTNFVSVMADVSAGGRLLAEEFKNNNVHPELAEFFGKLFGQLHGKTYGSTKEFIGSLDWKVLLLKFLPNKRYGYGLRKFFPERQILKVFENSAKAKNSLTWFDPVFKNIFIKDGFAILLDFEFMMLYDPAFDLGIFLAHWAWMLENESDKARQDSEVFIKNFIKAYKTEFLKNQKNAQKDLAKILERSLDWLALYLVSRTDGESGSYFKDYPKWEQKIRQLGIDLFAKNYKNKTALKIKKLISN